MGRKKQESFFIYNTKDKSTLVKGSFGRHLFLTGIIYTYFDSYCMPTRSPKDMGKMKPDLETFLNQALSKIPPKFKLQKGRDFGDHVRNAFENQDVKQAKDFLRDLPLWLE